MNDHDYCRISFREAKKGFIKKFGKEKLLGIWAYKVGLGQIEARLPNSGFKDECYVHGKRYCCLWSAKEATIQLLYARLTEKTAINIY